MKKIREWFKALAKRVDAFLNPPPVNLRGAVEKARQQLPHRAYCPHLVVAATLEQAKVFAWSRGWHHWEWVYVTGSEQLLNGKVDEVYYVGPKDVRTDDLIHIAIGYGYTIVRIKEIGEP